jgi:hypothetical protein
VSGTLSAVRLTPARAPGERRRTVLTPYGPDVAGPEREAGTRLLVVPELASAYTDRSWRRPGMITEGDVVVRAFGALGWTWAATFSAPKDTMHFSATGD